MHRLALPGLLLALAPACWSPRGKGTGPSNMEGVVLTAEGTPLAGLAVDTIESTWRTDAEGRFAVTYKEPSRFLHFEHEGLWFQRFYREADAGQDVTVRLPETQTETISCWVEEACDLTLVWEREDGLRTTLRGESCGPEDLRFRATVPDGPPTRATCRAGPTAPDVPQAVRRSRHGIEVQAEPGQLTVALRPHRGELPDDCVVTVDGVPATREATDRFRATASGTAEIHATCGGRPASPMMARVLGDLTVPVDWWATGPFLRRPEGHPGQSLQVYAIDGPAAYGWRLEVPFVDGIAHLPPLNQGTYAFGLDASWEGLEAVRPTPQSVPDVVQLVDMPDEGTYAPDEMRGVLQLSAPKAAGVLVVERFDAQDFLDQPPMPAP